MAIPPADGVSLDDLVAGLRAAGEETRLRVLALLGEGELNVSDLTDILGQSQPRISRHLKLLADAGLIERHREGAWAFFRLNERGPAGSLARELCQRLDQQDGILAADRARLRAVRSARAEAAQAYFNRHAADWDRLRSLHAAEADVEAQILDILGPGKVDALLDLGTGTGRMLALLAPLARRVVGVDSNHAMLAVARANLSAAGLRRVELRQGDVYAPPVERDGFDVVVLHQVLHFLDDPARALREAAATLAPGGRLLIVDFAPHALEFLREEHAHRRLGFEKEQILGWCREASLDPVDHRVLPAPARDRLAVSFWVARDRRAPLRIDDVRASKEVA